MPGEVIVRCAKQKRQFDGFWGACPQWILIGSLTFGGEEPAFEKN